MTNPALSASELNTLLIPKDLVGKTNSQQDIILNRNGSVRIYLFNLFFTLQQKANQRNPLRTLPQYPVNTSTGKIFSLTAKQQVSLYYFVLSRQTNGLGRLLLKSRLIQDRIKLWQSRGINNP
jgi:hypothetical protein